MRLEKFIQFLREKNLTCTIIIVPKYETIKINVHGNVAEPVLFSGEGVTIDTALDDLIATFQKVGYV